MIVNKQVLFAAVAATLGISSAMAQTAPVGNTSNTGYVIDARNVVARSGTGLCWRTGYWTPAYANLECDPDLVPKPPAPTPKPVTPVVPDVVPVPVAEKVTISADALFDFDKATLRPEGKTKLDELAAKAGAIKLELIVAVGHTDRLGGDKYNQALSEKRAAAVKEYLKSKGIEDKKIYTEGKGKLQPVTKPEQCAKMGKESGKNKKLVACLQPDRRVDIELVGTK